MLLSSGSVSFLFIRTLPNSHHPSPQTLSAPSADKDFADVDRLSTQELIKQNLEEPDARHKMCRLVIDYMWSLRLACSFLEFYLHNHTIY